MSNTGELIVRIGPGARFEGYIILGSYINLRSYTIVTLRNDAIVTVRNYTGGLS